MKPNRNSTKYLQSTADLFCAGCPRPVDELFSFYSTRKDYLTKWVLLYNGPSGKSDLANDWSDMVLDLLNIARQKWGNARFSKGVLLEKGQTEEETENNGFLNVWRESGSGIDQLFSKIKHGESIYPMYPDVWLLEKEDRFMVVDDYITFIEFDKRWQAKSGNLLETIIPDIWFFRTIECLYWIGNGKNLPYSDGSAGRATKAHIFIDPTWGIKKLVGYGYVKRSIHNS